MKTKRILILSFLMLIGLKNIVWSQSSASFGVTYTVLSADSGGAGTNSLCYIVPGGAAPLITWAYTFSSNPASVTMQLQGSDTNCSGTFYVIDSGTTVGGEMRFILGAPKALRIQINAKSGGGTTTATFNFAKYSSYQGGVLTKQLRVINGSNTSPGLSFVGNSFDGFYWLSNGAIVYSSFASPTIAFSSGIVVGSATKYCWGSSTSAASNQTGNLGDIGLNRLEAGILNIFQCDAAGTGGAIKLGDPGTRPTCDLAHRGTIFSDEGASLTKDAVAVCAKDASDIYAWRVIY